MLFIWVFIEIILRHTKDYMIYHYVLIHKTLVLLTWLYVWLVKKNQIKSKVWCHFKKLFKLTPDIKQNLFLWDNHHSDSVVGQLIITKDSIHSDFTSSDKSAYSSEKELHSVSWICSRDIRRRLEELWIQTVYNKLTLHRLTSTVSLTCVQLLWQDNSFWLKYKDRSKLFKFNSALPRGVRNIHPPSSTADLRNRC